MNELKPEQPRSPASPATGPDAAGRLALALGASLALHLALIFGIQARTAQESGKTQPAITVRIEQHAEHVGIPTVSSRELAVAPAKNELAELVHEEKAAPQPEPARPESAVAEQASSLLPALDVPLLEDPTWYPVKQLDVRPAALRAITPAYPDKASAQGVGGHVVLLLLIDEAGAVREASVAEADPEGIFEESALAAFRDARFRPAQKNGRAVKSRVLIRVTYELNDREKPVFVQPPLLGPP